MDPADLIKHFEGCRFTAYPDPATGGKPWTIGYGCTGPGIGPGLVWTQAQCDEALTHRLAVLVPFVDKLCPNASEGQLAALVSLAWNIGTSGFASSAVVREFRNGHLSLAAAAFNNWERAGANPHFLHGRREAEKRVFLGGVL